MSATPVLAAWANEANRRAAVYAAFAELIEAVAPLDDELPRLTGRQHNRIRAAIAAALAALDGGK